MFGFGKKAKPHPRDQRNPNYAQIFYPLLEAQHARVLEAGDHDMSLSRNEYETIFGAKLEEKYIKYKAERNATTYPFFAKDKISALTLGILSAYGERNMDYKDDPKGGYAFGYGLGLIDIGEILFALAPALSQHGLQEVEQISRSVISEIMDTFSGVSIGMAHSIKLSLSSQPV